MIQVVVLVVVLGDRTLQFLQIFFLFPFYKYVYLYIFGVYVLFFFELPWLNISRFLKDRDGLMVLVGGRNGFSGFLIIPKNISVRLCFWRPCCPLEVYTEGQKARLWMDCGINFGLWVKEAHTESRLGERETNFLVLLFFCPFWLSTRTKTREAGSSEDEWKAQMKERDTEAEQEVTWRPTGSQQAFPSTPHKTARTSRLFFFSSFFLKNTCKATLSRLCVHFAELTAVTLCF